jgi:hypothetical protein
MRKLSWVLLTLFAIGFAGGIALAGEGAQDNQAQGAQTDQGQGAQTDQGQGVQDNQDQ